MHRGEQLVGVAVGEAESLLLDDLTRVPDRNRKAPNLIHLHEGAGMGRHLGALGRRRLGPFAGGRGRTAENRQHAARRAGGQGR
jgi:hypothetical protein